MTPSAALDERIEPVRGTDSICRFPQTSLGKEGHICYISVPIPAIDSSEKSILNAFGCPAGIILVYIYGLLSIVSAVLAQNTQRVNGELEAAGCGGVSVGKPAGRRPGQIRHDTPPSEESGTTLGERYTSVPRPILVAALYR